MLWLMGERLCHALTTCHHLLPEQPSQSECEVGGLQGLLAPSGRSDCCCNCRGNQERQYDRLWHFLSSLHRTLSEKKQRRKRKRIKSQRVKLDGGKKKKRNEIVEGGFQRKVPVCAQIASISSGLQLDNTRRLSWVSECLILREKPAKMAAVTLSFESSCRQAE